MVYDWLSQLIGSGSDSNLILLSGFFVVMTYVIGVDLLIKGFRAIFKR